MADLARIVVVRDRTECRYSHVDRPLDRLPASTASTDVITSSDFAFPTSSRVVVVDLCKTDITPAVVTGLTLRNQGYFVIFDLCSDDPSELIHDLYEQFIETEKEHPIRGEAIVAEAALGLTDEIEKATRYFEQEFI